MSEKKMKHSNPTFATGASQADRRTGRSLRQVELRLVSFVTRRCFHLRGGCLSCVFREEGSGEARGMRNGVSCTRYWCTL